MKILIADQFSDLGGAQRVLLEFLPALQLQRWTPVLAAPGRGPLKTRAESLGIHCEDITCGPFGCGSKSFSDLLRFGSQFPKLRAQFRDLLNDVRPDVFYINAPRLIPAACSLGDRTPPILFHLHNPLTQRYAAALTGHSLRRAHASVVGNCHYVLEPLRPYLRNSSMEVAYNGVPDCGFREPKERTWRIGILGRVAEEKGQKIFVEAARLVHQALPLATFVICGGTQFSDIAESYTEEVRQLAQGLPIEFTGWRDDAADVLHGLDLLVVASLAHTEATTRVIPEAYSAGVPVIASDLPGVREILKDGHTGFLFPAGSARALADGIRELMSAPTELLGTVAANARADFDARFRINVFHRRMSKILERVGARALA
jgi:glycosyltransferase involved in cell wall biosynthesis